MRKKNSKDDHDISILRHLPRENKYRDENGDIDYTAYTADERRAALYNMVLEHGHPQHLPTYRQLGKKFGVSKSRIKQHMHTIREDFVDRLGSDIKVRTQATFLQAHKTAMQKEDYQKAVDIMMTWNEWLFDLGVQDRAPEKREVDLETSGRWTDEEVEELLDDHTEPET